MPSGCAQSPGEQAPSIMAISNNAKRGIPYLQRAGSPDGRSARQPRPLLHQWHAASGERLASEDLSIPDIID
jgi:hypothetical protein